LTKRASSSSEENEVKMATIAIVGSGAVGCYYGARLWETKEYIVKFLMRGEHFTVSREKGLNVTSVAGDIFIPPEELLVYDKVESMGKADWVILSLKSTSIEAIPSLIRPLVHENSRVIAIMNGLVDDDIVRLLEGQCETDVPRLTQCAAVYGGMAFLCSNRKSPGHVDHSYAGKLTASLSMSSEVVTDVNVHKEAIISLWKPTRGFEFSYDENLVRARWLKNLWNLPFNGISVAMNGITVDMIVGDPGLRKLAFKGERANEVCSDTSHLTLGTEHSFFSFSFQ
jgi:2-dehydropantoate 2-reductase